MKLSPLVIVAGGAALFLVLRSHAAAPKPLGNTQKTADYFTPTDLAMNLARLVVGVTQGIATPAVASLGNVQSASLPLTGSLLGDAAAWTSSAVQMPFSEARAGLWEAPTYQTSSVSSPSVSRFSSSVDSIAAAPVYSIDDDFLLNPLSLA